MSSTVRCRTHSSIYKTSHTVASKQILPYLLVKSSSWRWTL